jgi:hypothetical protein
MIIAAIIVAILLLAFLAAGMCAAAGKADRDAERAYAEFRKSVYPEDKSP